MGFKRHATAHWEGDLKTGQGRMSTPQSGLFDGTRYSFNTRFGEEKGSNPEELLAAAHAGCFSMALSAQLADNGTPAARIHTAANVHLEKLEAGFTITRVELATEVEAPGLEEGKFQGLAATAKANCPVSKALAGTEIHLQATLR